MKTWFQKIRSFFHEVVEEFYKCTRPSKEELKESTVVVVVTMAILGVFIFGADWMIHKTVDLVLNN